MAHFLTIVAGRPGGWVPFGLQQLLELLSEGIVPGAGDGAVAVALISVGSLARSEGVEPLLISSAGYALASDNCSILLSRLIHLANIRFLWIIDAAEEPEPGAHANDDVTTQ